MAKFRKKPVVISALQFTGDNVDELNEFTPGFRLMAERCVNDGPQVAQVYDHLHDTWVGVKVSDWILRGISGEFYPCDDAVFAATYEQVAA